MALGKTYLLLIIPPGFGTLINFYPQQTSVLTSATKAAQQIAPCAVTKRTHYIRPTRSPDRSRGRFETVQQRRLVDRVPQLDPPAAAGTRWRKGQSRRVPPALIPIKLIYRPHALATSLLYKHAATAHCRPIRAVLTLEITGRQVTSRIYSWSTCPNRTWFFLLCFDTTWNWVCF